MWPLHPIFHAALDKWPEALADTVLLGICEFTCGPQAASHHPWSRSCIPAFGYRTRVDHFHSGTPLLVVHALSCALPNCDPGWKSVVLNRSRERQICLVCMRGVKLMSLPERPPFACGAPEPLRHASGCFGLHLQAPNRPSRCRRFCSGQSLRKPSGSTAGCPIKPRCWLDWDTTSFNQQPNPPLQFTDCRVCCWADNDRAAQRKHT